MPKVAQHRALARQWEILKRLPARGPGITSRELVESLDRAGFQITKRTVERDLTELSMLFGIACNDGSVPYGWYWVRGECPDLPGVTLADALSLNMIEATLRPMLPPSALEALEQRFQIARRKLTELSQDNPNARWASKVSYVQPTMPLIPPIIPEGVWKPFRRHCSRSVNFGSVIVQGEEVELPIRSFIRSGLCNAAQSLI